MMSKRSYTKTKKDFCGWTAGHERLLQCITDFPAKVMYGGGNCTRYVVWCPATPLPLAPSVRGHFLAQEKGLNNSIELP